MSYANKAYDMELIAGYRMVSWGHTRGSSGTHR